MKCMTFPCPWRYSCPASSQQEAIKVAVPPEYARSFAGQVAVLGEPGGLHYICSLDHARDDIWSSIVYKS